MTVETITSLTATTDPDGTEEVPLNVGGLDRKVTIANIWKKVLGVVRIQNVIQTGLGTTGALNLDFATNEITDLGTITGNITFTTTNLASGRSKTIRIIGGSSAYTITLPATWKLLGGLTSPITLAIGKHAVLTATSFGTTDANVEVAYTVQS